MREKRNYFGEERKVFFMVRTLILLDQVPTLMSSFNFNYFLGPSSPHWAVGISTYELEAGGGAGRE